ncbi:MAG TPA: KH domain-containing protein, partial [bacterium]|nr:KH domain-containing protein [bacterium]
MKELIEYVAKSLVDKPEDVALQERMEGNLTVLELRVSKEDYGKVIGKQGRTIKAIRTLISASCAKNGLKYSLEVVE